MIMPQQCNVPSCGSSSRLHRFPRDSDMTEKWVAAVRVGKPDFKRRKYSVVCRKHFKPEDYELPKDSLYENPAPKLKRTAVPSIFPWTAKTISAWGIYRNLVSKSHTTFEDNLEALTNKIKQEIERNKKNNTAIGNRISRSFFKNDDVSYNKPFCEKAETDQELEKENAEQDFSENNEESTVEIKEEI